MASAEQLMHKATARLHAACGWVSFRLGFRARARRHFERVLLLKGDDFSAYIHLGRLAYDVGDYAGWRREFEHARRADPARFGRLRHPFELFEPRLAGTSFDDASERATWRSMRPLGGATPQRMSGPRLDGPEPAPPHSDGIRPRNALDIAKALDDWAAGMPAAFDVPKADGQAGPRPGPFDPADSESPMDDCGSAEERRRFRAMGPIGKSDCAACDVDDLARRLGA